MNLALKAALALFAATTVQVRPGVYQHSYQQYDWPIVSDFVNFALRRGGSVDFAYLSGVLSGDASDMKMLTNEYRRLTGIAIDDLDSKGRIKLSFRVKFVSAKQPEPFAYWAAQFKGDALTSNAFRSFEHDKSWPKGKLAKRLAYFYKPYFDGKGRLAQGFVVVANPNPRFGCAQDILANQVVCMYPAAVPPSILL